MRRRVSHAFLTRLARLLTHVVGIAIFLFHRHSLFVVGFVFSAGWTPCIGPIFGAIITYGSLVNPAHTLAVVTAYSLGFGVPFIIMEFFIGKTRYKRRKTKY